MTYREELKGKARVVPDGKFSPDPDQAGYPITDSGFRKFRAFLTLRPLSVTNNIPFFESKDPFFTLNRVERSISLSDEKK